MGTIRIHMNDIEMFTEVCYNLLKLGTQFTAYIVGKEWVIEMTGY
jgi:hypothetical protein